MPSRAASVSEARTGGGADEELFEMLAQMDAEYGLPTEHDGEWAARALGLQA